MSRRLYFLSTAAVLLTALVVYLAGNGSIGLWDRDEPRYAQASREMVQNSEWVMPTFLGEPRVNKPILIYWLQKLSMQYFGETVYAARFPSAVAMVGTLAMLAAVLPRIVGRRRAFWSVFVLATSAMVIASAKMCVTDAVLLLWITIAQLCVYSLWRGRGTAFQSWQVVVVLGAAVGLAMLTKGPVVLGIIGATIIALLVMQWITPGRSSKVLMTSDNEQRFLVVAGKWIAVLAIIAAVCLPWLSAIEQRQPGWLVRTISGEIIERGKSGMEGHHGWIGYYLTLIWATFFPWSLFLIAAVVHGFKRRTHPFTRFALAAIIGPYVMLEIYATKLPHYLLPAYPFLAFLVANVISLGRRKLISDLSDRPFVIAASIVAGAITILSLLLPIVPAMSDGESARHYFAMFALGSFIIGSVWYVVFKLSENRIVLASATMGIAMFLGVIILSVLYLPTTNFLRVSQRVAQILHNDGADERAKAGQVIMLEYKEPSLGFYQGGTIREQTHTDFLSITPPHRWPKWIVSETNVWSKQPEQIKQQFISIGRVRGLNVAEGRADVTVLRRLPTSEATIRIDGPISSD